MSPRHALIVLAHPCEDSFAAAVARTATESMTAAGATVEVLDLYACGFTAVMSATERAAYMTDTPISDPMVSDHAAAVNRADTLVFVYPTWWSGPPAILKGWLERVLVRGVAFDLDPRSGRIRPQLSHIRHIIGISTYGSPRHYVWAINDNGRRTLTRSLRLVAGWRTRTTWLGLYAIDTASERDRTAFMAKVADRVGRGVA